jgi:3-methylcrotonyl-CoA carboxylase alpha subunit
MIHKVLIANRGEIARRIIRTCRQQQIATVAIHAENDTELPHVLEADEAVSLGDGRAADTYLNIDAVLQAARDTGADAIHPGYGFLSENAPFADACEQAGLIFIGPKADAIRLMGDKAAARQRMADSGVPVLPGLDEPGVDDDTLRNAAGDIGFPLLIKAVAGGGGKGMRVVHQAEEFDDALAAARREASAAFSDDRVLLERYLPRARHVEVQVFADTHGAAVHLFERDCSVQRRHQKVIEEAPAPGLSDTLRREMGEAAVRAALAIDYRGAGTVEFLLDPEGRFYFMEMNTRLQVEHPVTELITGQDLVAWQLRVADGQPLPCQQSELAIQGAAMEVRIYAEDPGQGFLPSSGLLVQADWPHAKARVDTGFEQGNLVSDQYDPMIAKIICHGPDRESARRRLCQALRETCLQGPRHNIAFLLQVLESDAFREAKLDTRLLEQHPGLLEIRQPDERLLLAAAILTLSDNREANSDSPWASLSGWRPLGERRYSMRLGLGSEAHLVSRVSQDRAEWLEIDGETLAFRWHPGKQLQQLVLGEQRLAFRTALDQERITVFVDGQPWPLELDPSPEHLVAADDEATAFAAPMSGTVVMHHVDAGTRVEAGTAVITMEAMKMEHTLRAPVDGRVVALPFAAGDTVTEGAVLAEFEAEDTNE